MSTALTPEAASSSALSLPVSGNWGGVCPPPLCGGVASPPPGGGVLCSPYGGGVE